MLENRGEQAPGNKTFPEKAGGRYSSNAQRKIKNPRNAKKKGGVLRRKDILRWPEGRNFKPRGEERQKMSHHCMFELK